MFISFEDRLLGQLSHGKYSFPDDTFLLMKRGGKGGKSGSFGGKKRLCVASRRDIVQEAKESFCKFSDHANPGAFSADEEQGKTSYNIKLTCAIKLLIKKSLSVYFNTCISFWIS